MMKVWRNTAAPRAGRYGFRSAIVAIGVIVAWASLPSLSAQAAPADRALVKTFYQPDGSPLPLRIWGDEFANGYETLNGFTVLYDRGSGRFEYAVRTRTGDLRPSGKLATRGAEPSLPRHLRPTRAVVDAKRRAEGVLSLAETSVLGAPPWAGSDTDVLFLAVEFSDVGCTFTPSQHETNLFGGGATGPGDLDDYYREISYGQLELEGDVVGTEDGSDCIQLSETKAHYDTPETSNDDDLVREAVDAADPYVDFDQYDNDGDGEVDALGIIYAGGGAHDGCYASGRDGRLWPHSGRVNTGGLPPIADFRTVERFIINSEVTYSLDDKDTCDEIQTIGLIAHEFGHSLGLPDLYDTDEGDQGGAGVDKWSTMASQYLGTVNNSDTPPHFDPWSKAILGWIAPTEQNLSNIFNEPLEQVETSGEVHQFLPNLFGFENSDDGVGEYFLVENRQQTGFDAQLPGCGILVWHIDEAQDNNQENYHRLVDLEQADGLFHLNNNEAADAGDPFPGSEGKILFGDTTTPDSKLYNGNISNFQMRARTRDCASSMTAQFGPNSPPDADAAGDYTTPEGTDATLDGTGSSDPEGHAITHGWEFDVAESVYDDATGAIAAFDRVGDDLNEKVIGLRVTDEYGLTDIDAAKVTVTNVAPAVELVADGPRPEGSLVTLDVLVSDPGWKDDLTATIDWGDGAGPQPLVGATEKNRPNATITALEQHVYGDNGLYPVEVCASDDDGGSSCSSTQVLVTNVAPEISGVGNTGPKPENDAVRVSAQVSDPGWLDALSATVDWGDGTGPQPLAGETENERPDATLAIDAEHVYGDNGIFTVTLCAADDDDGAAVCKSTDVVIGNVDPTATIDTSGAETIDGVKVLFGKVGQPLTVNGRITDPGSDDETARWMWDDGSPDTVTSYWVNLLFPDTFPSPTIEPRDLTDTQSHTFTACVYDVGFRAADDDVGASPTDMVKVLITGNSSAGRQSGYWAHQYRRNGTRDFTDQELACYLEVTDYLSDVFHEARDASTFDRAQAVLFAQGASVTKRDQLDRDLLTAWLNFSNGAVGWNESVDTNGDGVVDTPFHQAMATAEVVRLDPGATSAQIEAQRSIINRINDTI